MVEGLDPVELDGLPLCHRAGLRRPQGARRRTSTIEVDAYDEMNIAFPVDKIAARDQASRGMPASSALSACRSNQFPRAMAIARQFRQRASTVAIGGFHVSGCISMLKELTPELKEAVDLGIVLFAGEAEEQFERVPEGRSCAARPKPLYNHMHALPNLQGTDDPLSAAAAGAALRRRAVLVRRRARLPVPMLLLHHHQRAGPKIALARCRRHRAHRPGERRAGHLALLRHRRQFRPQQELGSRSSTA